MTSYARTRPRVGAWPRTHAPARAGHLPTVLLITSIGLVVIAVGNNGARVGAWWGEPMFWLGLATIFGAIVYRVLSPGVSRGELILLVALAGVALFMTKHLGNPLAFERYDELLHQRTLNDIVTTGRLFIENPLLPISPLYPGLEVSTAAIIQLTDTSYVTAGAIVLIVGRLVLVLGLFLLYETITGSPRIAAIAALLYMTHQNFVQFNAAFAYESLAIPIGVGLIYLLVRQERTPLPRPVFLILAAALSLGIAATHHVTSLALLAFLWIWAALSLIPFKAAGSRWHVLTGALLMTAAFMLWMLVAGDELIGYLAPVIQNAVGGVVDILTGQGLPRDLFVSRRGVEQPLWSRLLGTASPVIMIAAIPIGLFAIWRAARQPLPSIAVVPATLLSLVALAYPASLVFRLTSQGGAQTSGRSSEFLFLGVAFVTALAAEQVMRRFRFPHLSALAGAVVAVVLLMGGVILGTPEWSRLPLPYTPGADSRSIEEHALSVRDWADAQLEPDARIAGDRMTRTLIGASGGHAIVSQVSTGFPLWTLFFSTDIEGRPIEVIRQTDVEFVVVDSRLAGVIPRTVYVEPGEQFRIQTGPLQQAAVEKWESIDWVSRAYDDGAIYVYDLTAVPSGP